MSSYSDEDYDQIAKTLREALGLDRDIWLDVLDALRRMKHCGYRENSTPLIEMSFDKDPSRISKITFAAPSVNLAKLAIQYGLDLKKSARPHSLAPF
jgi:hypothetical protein